MHPQIQTLLEVQALDEELLTVNNQLSKYPVIWEEVKKRLAKKKDIYEKAAKELDRQQKERKRTEQKLRLYADDLRKYQGQQAIVKTPREYEAITKQIDTTKKKIEQTQESAEALIGKDEGLKEAVAAAEQEFNKVKEHYLKEKERIRVQFNEKKERVKLLERERAKITPKVDPQTLATYETINERYPANAIVPVQGNSCTGCHWQVLPELLVAIHRGEEIVSCSNCSRLISEDVDYDPAVEEE